MVPVSHEEYKNATTASEIPNTELVVAFIAVAAVVIVLAVLGNALEIIVVCMSPQMRSLSDMFVLNLACCQLLQATFCMPFSLYNLSKYGHWDSSQVLCAFWLTLVVFSVQVSAFSLCLVVLDIYFEIIHQKWYRNWLKTRKVVLALCTAWAIPLAVNMWPLVPSLRSQLFETNNNKCEFHASAFLVYASATFDFFLPGVCVTALYLFVFCHCRKRLQVCHVTRTDYADFSRIFDPFEYRSLIVVGVQVCAFVVMWAPFWILTCIYTSMGTTQSFLARKAAIWVCYLTTLVNPMLHIFGNWKFQFLLKRIFGWKITLNTQIVSRRSFTFAQSFRKSVTSAVAPLR